MSKLTTVQVTVVDQNKTYTRLEICQQLSIPEALLIEMEAHGLFEPIQKNTGAEPVMSEQHRDRIAAACRLHEDLGVNLPGVILALELLDELEVVRRRLAILERIL